MFNPLFDKKPVTPSSFNITRPVSITASASGASEHLSPISKRPMNHAFIGDIPILVDLENRVVMPVTK